MRLAVDTALVGSDGSGNETFTRGLVGGLLDTALRPGDSLRLLGGRWDEATLADPRVQAIGLPPSYLGDLALGPLARRHGADAFLASYNAPVGFSGPVATVVHDVAYLRVPETYPALLRRRIQWSVARSVRVSELIATPSQHSAGELVATHPRLRRERVVVTGEAVDATILDDPTPAALAQARARLGVESPFILAVGTVQPRKNLRRLVAASAGLGVPLVAVGRPGWKSEEEAAQLQAPHVRWLGYVERADLAALYRSCTLFAYPSVYEGFGLPVLEAMAAGAPVVTSRGTSMEEVAQGCAELVDPYDVAAIRGGLERVLGDPTGAAERAARGRAVARSCTWGAAAQRVLEPLRALVS